MIGLIKLHPINCKPIYINPGMITLIGDNDAENGGKHSVIHNLLDIDNPMGKSVVIVAGMVLQTMESPKEIISALTNLRVKTEEVQTKYVRRLRKEMEREDWQDGATDTYPWDGED